MERVARRRETEAEHGRVGPSQADDFVERLEVARRSWSPSPHPTTTSSALVTAWRTKEDLRPDGIIDRDSSSGPAARQAKRLTISIRS